MDRVAFRKVEELPLVLTPMDIAAVLGISRNTAYELIHSEDFPILRVGPRTSPRSARTPGAPFSACSF